MKREKERAFQRGLRRRACYRGLVWSYRGVLVAIVAGVPLLEHATGTARDWAVLGFVLAFLTAWAGALAAMFLLLRAVPVLRGPSPYIPAFLRALLSDLLLLERRTNGSARLHR